MCNFLDLKDDNKEFQFEAVLNGLENGWRIFNRPGNQDELKKARVESSKNRKL